VLGYALLQRNGIKKIGERQEGLTRDFGRLTLPMTSSIRNFNPVFSVKTAHTTERVPVYINRGASDLEEKQELPESSLTIFAAEPQKSKPDPGNRGPRGDYAPAFRLVRCQLVNTVDSSNIATPIIGLVTADVWWNGKVIIHANSEVHGAANIDLARERIASNGEFTFVLKEPNGLGRELVIRGMALDMEKDESLDTYGITDGSAGLRGDVIRSKNSDVIQLYAASLISGVTGAFSSGVNGLLGNRIYTNRSAMTMSTLQNGLINPTAGGIQAALDRYAERISASIEKDGFFIRVPAGKQFYVYCTEAIDLNKAKLGADDERLTMEQQDLDREKLRNEVRRALPVEPADLINSLMPSLTTKGHNLK
jgi:hypothetical protein